MAKGESEMWWYVEVVLSYIRREKQSDMEAEQQSTSFFFLTFPPSLIPSPIRSCGERVTEKKQAVRLLVQKFACGWHVASSPSIIELIRSCSGEKNVPQESMNHRSAVRII